MNEPLTIEIDLHAEPRGKGGRKTLVAGPTPPPLPEGTIPRVSRLMALALSIEARVEAGEITNYSEAASTGQVTRARMTQIVNLTNLAPDVQEQLLHLPRTETGHDRILLKDLQPLARELDWRVQRLLWRELLRRAGITPELP